MTAVGVCSTYLGNKLLDHTFAATAYTRPATVYLAIMTTPSTPDTAGTEVTGGSYARKSMTFAAAASGSIETSASITFAPLQSAAEQTAVGWAIYDASTSGNMLFQGSLPFPLVVPANQTIVFAAGAFAVRFSEDCSTYLANKWLEFVLKNTAFSSPTDVYGLLYSDSTLATEVTGGSYARQAVAFNASASRVGVSSASESWPMPTTTVYGWGISDASTSGNLLASDLLRDSTGNSVTRGYTSGDTADIDAGAIIVQVG